MFKKQIDCSEIVEKFMDLNPVPGFIITHNWIDSSFNLKKGSSHAEYERYQLQKMSCLDKFRLELLEKYQIALKNVQGVGYSVIAPKSQTEYAMKLLRKELRKSFKNSRQLLENIQLGELNEDERKYNTDAKTKLAFMSMTTKKTMRMKLPR
jgi:hypothetical protein